MVHLTEHFKDMWSARGNGPVPSPEEVAQLIAGAVRLQAFRSNVFTPRGRRMKFLALYWIPQQSIVLKVDEGQGEVARVVTVLTPSTKDEEPYARNGADRQGEQG